MSMMDMMSMAHPSMEMMMGPHGMGLTGPPFPPNGMMGPPPPPPPPAGTGMMGAQDRGWP